MADQAQRSRSVYIGNLPWDVKEEELKKIFSQVGTIVSLRMPVDPENQRSRGFAFCEFQAQDSVATAIKHFNGYELNGRKIRVDSAANNADKDSKGGSGPFTSEHKYGEPCEPVRAPEIIAEVIGHLSPEQVHAIISEARRCLEGDPQEARVALVNNPQITYALLLALVRGRYITAESGTEALVKAEHPLLPLFPDTRALPMPVHLPQLPVPPLMGQPMRAVESLGGGLIPQLYGPPSILPHSQLRGPPPRPYPEPSLPSRHYNDQPPASLSRQPFNDREQQGPPQQRRNVPLQDRSTARKPTEPHTPYNRSFNEPVGLSRGGDSRRDRHGSDRTSRFESTDRSPVSVTKSPRISTPPPAASSASQEEQEKAELIMQVLKLKEEDIVKMAPEQQRTVRALRDQFKNINQ